MNAKATAGLIAGTASLVLLSLFALLADAAPASVVVLLDILNLGGWAVFWSNVIRLDL